MKQWTLFRKLVFWLGAGLFFASFFDRVDDTLVILGAILFAQAILDRGCISCRSGSCEYMTDKINENGNPDPGDPEDPFLRD